MGRLKLVLALVCLGTQSAASSSAADAVSANEVSPVGKVVELLDVLLRELDADGKADSEAYVKYVAWHHNESAKAKTVAFDTKATISLLQTGLDDDAVFLDAQKMKLEKVAGELAAQEQDLKEATDRRAQERATFDATEKTLMEGIDQLERSLIVLGKEAPAETGGGASLSFAVVSAAKKLRVALLQGDGRGVPLTPVQRGILDQFLREAGSVAADAPTRRLRADRHPAAIAPDFLQVRTQAEIDNRGDHGEYTSNTWGVVSTLQSVLDKANEELGTARDAESHAQKEFVAYESGLQKEIDNKKNTLSEVKVQISQAQQSASQKEGQLASEQELLKVTEADLVESEASYQKKSQGYRDRMAKRSDEVMAVQEATQLLTSEAARQLFADGNEEPSSFLQVSQHTRARAMYVLRSASTPAVALLALRMQTRTTGRRHRSDPFAKIKTMIQELLAKLQAEASKEAQHKAWCDSEMSKSTKSQKGKQDRIQKINNRIGAMDADLSQLTLEITTATQDLANMREATAAAMRAREEERARATSAIQKYKNAQELLKTAINVLKKFYSSDAATPPPPTADQSEAYKAQRGAGTGVIGILEIALEDYAELQQETETTETDSEKDYKELLSESEIKSAVFQKDLEYKTRHKVALDGDKMRASADLKNYEKELQAVETYLEKLNEGCIGGGETYEERKERRDMELQSLREALDYLTSENGPA